MKRELKRVKVTVCGVVTYQDVHDFMVLAEDIILAQKRVMLRIYGIMKTTMYQIKSAELVD